MRQAQTFDFLFKNVEKQFESYQGINVKLRCAYILTCLACVNSDAYYLFRCCRYLIKVTISRRIADVTKEKDLWVHSYRMPPDSNNSIKMEVGIEDCLHIEFEYNKSKYVVTLSRYQNPPFTAYILLVPCYGHVAHVCADTT